MDSSPAFAPAAPVASVTPLLDELVDVGTRRGSGRVLLCTVRVRSESRSVRRVRLTIAEDLRGRGWDEAMVHDAEIVTSELLTNAVRHARPLSDGTIRVRWKVRAETVEIDVTDGGSSGTAPRPAPSALWSDAGRGLRIVRAIAHEWGVTEDRTGHLIWATLGGPSRRRVS